MVSAGKNISLKCPNCGSGKVGLVGPGIIGILFFGFILFFSNGHHSQNPLPDTGAQIPQATAEISSPSDVNQTPHLNEQSPPQLVSRLNGMDVAAVVPQEAPENKSAKSPENPTLLQPESAMKTYSDEEITAMENEKKYHGDDSIIRARLGLPSRETKQLIK
jgi:hypothetical protein